MLLAALLACNEYLFEEKPEPGVAELSASVRSPTVPHCAGNGVRIELANEGTGPVVVSKVDLSGTGWSLANLELPLTLPADGRTNFNVVGDTGAVTLIIHSDDPASPALTLGFEAQGNVGPTALVVQPYEEQAVAEGESLELLAFVADPDHALEELSLSWVSSETGLLAPATADADGRVSTLWSADDRAAGPQYITLEVADPCGAIGDYDGWFCQDGPFPRTPLTDEAWITAGTATLDGGVLTLTPGSTAEAGAAFDAASVFDGDRVEINFSAQLSAAAEGFSVTLLDDARRSDWLGGAGCGLGFGTGLACTEGPALPGWSLAVDVHADPGDCLDVPHLAFIPDGDLSAPAACAALPAFEDGEWVELSVVLESGLLNVSWAGAPLLDAVPVPAPAFVAYLGFTGSSSGAAAPQAIRDVTVVDSTCE